jgi:hypothetical protein
LISVNSGMLFCFPNSVRIVQVKKPGKSREMLKNANS